MSVAGQKYRVPVLGMHSPSAETDKAKPRREILKSSNAFVNALSSSSRRCGKGLRGLTRRISAHSG